MNLLEVSNNDTGTILIGYCCMSKNGVAVNPTSSQWRALGSFVFICTLK